MKRIAAALLFTAAAVAAPLQAADEVSLNANDIKWGPVPPVLPKGAKIAVLNGDPFKPGLYTIRLSTPANYKIAPHWHTQAEDLTIVSGALYLGMGDKMDAKGAHALKAGGFHHLPGKMHHYAFSKSPTVIQISGEGPFDINYLNPKDDPSGPQK
jgi:hypothetical protein